MKSLALTCSIALGLISGTALAQDAQLEELNRLTFESVDANGDGIVSGREVDLFREIVMISQDYNDNGIVTLQEHLDWDMGWADLARERGLEARFTAARRAVFDVWDKDNDGTLSQAEQQLSQSNDFYLAAGQSNQALDYKSFTTGLRIIAEMNAVFSVEGPVTLINVFEVPDGAMGPAIEMWTQSRDFLQMQPGYVSTALQRSIGPDARFQLINIAKWESVEAFQAATAAMRATSGIKPVEGVRFDAGLYQTLLTD